MPENVAENEGLLGRNFLKGMKRDALNAVLCGVGHNLRRILARARFGLYEWGAAWVKASWWTRSIPVLRLQAA